MSHITVKEIPMEHKKISFSIYLQKFETDIFLKKNSFYIKMLLYSLNIFKFKQKFIYLFFNTFILWKITLYDKINSFIKINKNMKHYYANNTNINNDVKQ